MRGLAAIGLVLISHFSLVFVGLFDPNPVVQSAGFLGVELFFVLSGFLIGQILLRTVLVSPFLPTVKIFWSRRWFSLRTLPAYYVVMTILLVLSAAGLWAPAFDQRIVPIEEDRAGAGERGHGACRLSDSWFETARCASSP